MHTEYRRLLSKSINDLTNSYIRQNNVGNQAYISKSGTSGGTVFVPNEAYRQSIIRFTAEGVNPISFNGVSVQYRDYNNNQELLFLTMCSWLPGNIFSGPIPNLRMDDPGDGFETNSRPIVGENQYSLASELNILLKNLTYENHDVQRISRVFDIIRFFSDMPVTEFNSRNWEIVEVKSKKNTVVKQWRIKNVNLRPRKKRNFDQQTTQLNIQYKQNAFCDPIDLLSIIYFINKNNNEKEKQEKQKKLEKEKKGNTRKTK
ncbi:uncharacterized protein LOC132941447 [Metopolophium dirhodum]|uniref:uncharacterized protein LOC132941447 n=1 Tax=Metopolophium dirhodum TaxID=44670 RepID=UPI002990163D|nr:uncharacterized protein LOC132941447 [Metopolophium dirhodum]